MSVQIYAQPSLTDKAREVFERELGDRKGYDSTLRELAIAAIGELHPAYIRETEYHDQWGTNAAIWAMGGLLGVAIDPPQPLRGLRAVVNWRQEVVPAEEFNRWLLHVLRAVRPINAMAQLDRELLMGERGLSGKAVEGR